MVPGTLTHCLHVLSERLRYTKVYKSRSEKLTENRTADLANSYLGIYLRKQMNESLSKWIIFLSKSRSKEIK